MTNTGITYTNDYSIGTSKKDINQKVIKHVINDDTIGHFFGVFT